MRAHLASYPLGSYNRSMAERRSFRVDVGEVTLAWGNAVEWKARFREEALQRHLARPVAERLRVAISMLRPASSDDFAKS